jgi:putative transposase
VTTYSPTHVWRGRPRPRDLSLGNRASFRKYLRPHVHVSQTRIIGSVTLRAERRPGAAAPHKQSCMSTNQTLEKYRYRRRLPHLQKADAALFVTFCTGAKMVIPERARDLVLANCLREAGTLAMAGECARPTPAARIRLHAVVVMPDHVHVLLTPLRNAQGWAFPLVDVLQCPKSATAHRINRLLGISGPVWEEESFDHVLRSDESLKEKCEYIRQNPVKAGLVDRAEDYKWLWVNPDAGG